MMINYINISDRSVKIENITIEEFLLSGLNPQEWEDFNEYEARLWRDKELEASDFIVPLTDHPKHAAYMTYRQELRDYPAQEDFPNGQRPLKP